MCDFWIMSAHDMHFQVHKEYMHVLVYHHNLISEMFSCSMADSFR